MSDTSALPTDDTATPATPGATPAADAPVALDYPCGIPPEGAQAVAVAPGVLWLRMPLPFALAHLNAWAIADADERGPGWAIVDTGTQTAETLAVWRQLIAPDGPLAGYAGPGAPGTARVTRVFVTHMHPDHIGMAGWLTRKFGCRLWMTRLEYLMCRSLVADTGREAPEDAIRFYREAGWDDGALDVYRARFGGFGKFVHAMPDSFRRLEHGQTLRLGAHDWRVVVGRGHSPEHACLVCDSLGVLVSGDQVLPKISSNVSVFPTEPDADPLGDWIASIAELRGSLAPDLLVLPAHGEPFRGLHARLDRLAHGHDRGLERLRRSLRTGPKRAVDVFGALFARPIGAELLGLATGESLAHLNHLRALGEVVARLDADGQRRYRLVDGQGDRPAATD